MVPLLAVLVSSNLVVGQDETMPEQPKVPEPERVLMETRDGVELHADWYGGAGGKEAVPVILLHDWDSDRSKLLPLAAYLQKQRQYAVLVPDLRGHGESLTVKGSDDELQRSRFKKIELASMWQDIESCRRFLQEKNDAGELNLSLLVVLACGKTGIHATNWCVTDWSWPRIGGVKQGQNVKALILISPRRRFKSLKLNDSLKSVLLAGRDEALPVLLVWGDKHAPADKDGSFIYETLAESRDQPEEFDDVDDQWQRQNLFRVVYDSDREAERLLEEKSSMLFPDVALFIEKKVADRNEDFPWESRQRK